MRASTQIVSGRFFGGEIEKGTFHHLGPLIERLERECADRDSQRQLQNVERSLASVPPALQKRAETKEESAGTGSVLAKLRGLAFQALGLLQHDL